MLVEFLAFIAKISKFNQCKATQRMVVVTEEMMHQQWVRNRNNNGKWQWCIQPWDSRHSEVLGF